ncbi:Polysaccharide pyruvyl transferase [Xylanibacter ruminicola]|uniref:Polysaccharide pyruvyl transferase n=1 Tax=Xylanibacter ruminicola TaxID=839 RepID=A0A1M7FK27_XYLRU|nr:polysaccharide pyruvyl transferase family protein [Xylanibacter ruminicola]SHM04363.1 Polysaccharide pyruvyl transferase [Xylanibacter ruminicola]
MKILLTGVETQNKGAELMLYAILQAIERKHPNAIIYLPSYRIPQGVNYISTKIDFRLLPFDRIEQKLKLAGIFRLLHLPYRLLPHSFALRKTDYYIDGSGFVFSDQFNITSKTIFTTRQLLDFLSNQGCRIIYLPQAFGPAQKKTTKEMLGVLSKYATLMMPREKISYDILQESGVVDMNKVKLFSDFTSIVDGVFPSRYEHLRNGICVIPNVQMINKGAITIEKYIALIERIILTCRESGKIVYLLNHEGEKDEQLCYRIKENLPHNIEVVTGINALEVKGLIGSAYLVVSSRFHGVASSLNSCVPCLATSWSHKYQELFKDYQLNDCVLPLDDEKQAIDKIHRMMDEDQNLKVRENLHNIVPHIKSKTREMWELIWNC